MKKMEELMLYLKFLNERKPYECSDEIYFWDLDPNYSYGHWSEELRMNLSEYNTIISHHMMNKNLKLNYEEFTKTNNEEMVKTYLMEHPFPDDPRTTILIERDLAIKEWFKLHGLDHTTDPNVENREKYIWWYINKEKTFNGEKLKDFRKNEIDKRNKLGKELVMINNRLKKINKILQPWNVGKNNKRSKNNKKK